MIIITIKQHGNDFCVATDFDLCDTDSHEPELAIEASDRAVMLGTRKGLNLVLSHEWPHDTNPGA